MCRLSLTAIVGVDSNDQTRPGKGSIVFSVTIGKKTAFQSALMREGMPAVPVQVDLDGAREFVLNVGEGGDGIACDQADWADAKVVMADGQTVWPGDLPISAAPQPYDTDPFFSFTYDGKPSADLLKTWELKRSSRQLDPHRAEYTLSYTDSATGLVVRCVGVAWKDYPTVEWTMYQDLAPMLPSSSLRSVAVRRMGAGLTTTWNAPRMVKGSSS